jgi:hypothetical protein
MSHSIQEIDHRTSEASFCRQLAQTLGLETTESEKQASTEAARRRLQRRIDGHTEPTSTKQAPHGEGLR